MEGIKYVNLIEIGPVVIEIRGVENGELAVPVNNTLVSHTTFLAADTRPCVLIICLKFYLSAALYIILCTNITSYIVKLSSGKELFSNVVNAYWIFFLD